MATCGIIQFSFSLVLWLSAGSSKKPESDTLKSWDLKKKTTFWFPFIGLLGFKPLELPPLSSPLQQQGPESFWYFFPGKADHLFQATWHQELGVSVKQPLLQWALSGNTELSIFFFTSSSYCCIHNSVKGRKMEGEPRARGEDSTLPLTLGRRGGNVRPFQKPPVLPLGWSLDLSFYLYWILPNDKIMPHINALYATVKERKKLCWEYDQLK